MSPITQTDGYHHGDLRKALLKAGEQLLVKRGLAALSLREVAQQAGVSHAAPYRHFKGKAALMQAMATAGFERLHSAISTSVDQIPHDPERKLLAATVAYADLAMRNPDLLQLMFGAAFEPQRGPELQPVPEAVFEALVAIMRTGIEAGVFRDRDPRELALVAWTSMHGLAMLLAAGKIGINARGAESLEKLASSVIQNLLYGISR